MKQMLALDDADALIKVKRFIIVAVQNVLLLGEISIRCWYLYIQNSYWKRAVILLVKLTW